MRNEKVDTIIDRSADFAQPILHHLRELVHNTVPDIVENIKWGMPFFEYKKANLCHMASFKKHCSFGFWLGSKMQDTEGIFQERGENGMGQLGKITSMADLPSDKILIQYLYEAAQLIDQGVKLEKKPTGPKVELKVPSILQEALEGNQKAKITFASFSASNRKDYNAWITEAKTEATRMKRLETAIEWMSEGKPRMWKYMKK